MSSLSPRDIVSELNRHIVGQENAKKAVALALRHRSDDRMLAPFHTRTARIV